MEVNAKRERERERGGRGEKATEKGNGLFSLSPSARECKKFMRERSRPREREREKE